MEHLHQIAGVGPGGHTSSSCGLADQLCGGMDVGALQVKRGLFHHEVAVGIDLALRQASNDTARRVIESLSK